MSMRACAHNTDRLAHQIELGDVSKTFAAVRALDSVSLAARAGELLAITGPSGPQDDLCRIVAGLETPDAGSAASPGGMSPRFRRPRAASPTCSSPTRFIRT
jgi:ABC-type sugar transport system ATPase subunit